MSFRHRAALSRLKRGAANSAGAMIDRQSQAAQGKGPLWALTDRFGAGKKGACRLGRRLASGEQSFGVTEHLSWSGTCCHGQTGCLENSR